LASFFQPVNHLETAAVSRSSDSQGQNPLQKLVFLPENGINIQNQKLQFDFIKSTTNDLELKILNNKEQPIQSETIPANVYFYSIKLNLLKPGRYYWQLRLNPSNRKLRRKFGVAIGYFFIHKDLIKK